MPADRCDRADGPGRLTSTGWLASTG